MYWLPIIASLQLAFSPASNSVSQDTLTIHALILRDLGSSTRQQTVMLDRRILEMRDPDLWVKNYGARRGESYLDRLVEDGLAAGLIDPIPHRTNPENEWRCRVDADSVAVSMGPIEYSEDESRATCLVFMTGELTFSANTPRAYHLFYDNLLQFDFVVRNGVWTLDDKSLLTEAHGRHPAIPPTIFEYFWAGTYAKLIRKAIRLR